MLFKVHRSCMAAQRCYLEVNNDASLFQVLVSIKQAADLESAGWQMTCPESLQIIPGHWEQTSTILGIPLACSSAISPVP